MVAVMATIFESSKDALQLGLANLGRLKIAQ